LNKSAVRLQSIGLADACGAGSTTPVVANAMAVAENPVARSILRFLKSNLKFISKLQVLIFEALLDFKPSACKQFYF
jgi:hypothetical protein